MGQHAQARTLRGISKIGRCLPGHGGWLEAIGLGRYLLRVVADDELMRRFYEGPPEESRRAYEELFRRLWSDTFRVACRFTRDADTAKDLAQKAWINVAQTRDGNGRWVAGVGSVRSWILRIVQNVGKDHVRSAWAKYRTSAPEDDDGQPIEGWLGFALPAEADPSLVEALRHCLDALRAANPSGFEIFVAREWRELEWTEIAEEQASRFEAGREPASIANTCKGRHRAAKKSLKECLEPRLTPVAESLAEEARP